MPLPPNNRPPPFSPYFRPCFGRCQWDPSVISGEEKQHSDRLFPSLPGKNGSQRRSLLTMALPPIYRVIVLGSRSTHSSKRKLEEEGGKNGKKHYHPSGRARAFTYPSFPDILLSVVVRSLPCCHRQWEEGGGGEREGSKSIHCLIAQSHPPLFLPLPPPLSRRCPLRRRKREEEERRASMVGWLSLPSLSHT